MKNEVFRITLVENGKQVEVEIARNASTVFGFIDEDAMPIRSRKNQGPLDAATEVTKQLEDHQRKGWKRTDAVARALVLERQSLVIQEIAKIRKSMRRLEQLGLTLNAVDEAAKPFRKRRQKSEDKNLDTYDSP
jgi:hypothetical protein